jgi:putative restriction endonuclease
MHQDILAAVGLDLGVPAAASKIERRDFAFHAEVLRAYDYRCAVCSFSALLDNRGVGVEAAHVQWHSH